MHTHSHMNTFSIHVCRLTLCSHSSGRNSVLHTVCAHTQACTHAWYPLIAHTGLCGAWAHFIAGCCPCAGLPKQSSSQETQWITPDTSVFSINCHPWHSALSTHRAQFLHSKFLSRSKVCPVSDFHSPAHKLWVLFQCMPAAASLWNAWWFKD